MIAAPPIIDFETIVSLLRERAVSQRDKRAFTFLVDGETDEVFIT